MELDYIDKLDESSILNKDIFFQLFAIEEDFERVEKYQQLENRAAELKIKSKFKSLYKAFEKDFKKALPERKDISSNLTTFTGQPELNCGVWNAGDDGIFILTDKGRIYACYHPIFPARILVNIETGTCKVELHYKVRGRWRDVLIEKSVIASRSSITKLSDYGIQVTSENAGALVQYLMDVEALNSDVICEYESSSKLGWIDDKFMPYEKDIAFDNEQNLSKLYKSIDCVGSRLDWYKIAGTVRRMGRIEPLLFMAASFAAVLVEPCGVLPFIVALWGETGGGKTVSLKLASSIWADPSDGQYISDAKSTITSMELKLNTLNSLPFLVDDFSQIKNQYDGDFSQFIYFLTAGSGKDRATTSLGLRGGTNWKNCTLANAERSLVAESTQGGAVNRVIEVEVEQDIYPKSIIDKIVSCIFDNYGFAGYEFIEVIRELGFDKVREIRKEYENRLVHMSDKSGERKEMKQIIPVSVLLTADEIAEQYLFKDGIRLNIRDCYNLIKGHDEVSENVKAYQYMKDVIASNFHKFNELDCNGELWGDYDRIENKVRFIGSIFDRVLKQGGFQPRTFLSWAAKNNIVETDAKGNTKIPTWMGVRSSRCVYFRIIDDSKLESLNAALDDNPFS